ncbi:hypothetical protein SAMN05444280_12635 [Tangfeifania diversioriginum]|uniref:Uncharacterized protein n=1 Tax=Tangfeifania diversioriginum TaxID=1168035 RepID=A0A1M6LBI5_9BACT|nr:hypothetical protein [Tangfeifania diversioriginum]SHJ68528.1 hypothetical protein SAMN05444280_12635 [Tangfeifania diversioriginum]
MQSYTPAKIALRVVIYSLLVFGIAEAIRFDAISPLEDALFGEISRTELLQELILLALAFFYLMLGKRHQTVQPVSNLVGLFLLIGFIRELNFLIDWWFWPALMVLLTGLWLVWRDFKKLKSATREFFSQPASAWFFAGILITYVFSRLMGRSKLWLELYDENNYRMAKAATEEGLELMGDLLLLISAIEFALAFWNKKRKFNS